MTEGRKDDTGKLRYDLVPFAALDEVVDVLTYGAQKYAPENWRHVPDAQTRYFAAAMRHLSRWKQGEIVDDETGCDHLAHAVCCLMFLIELGP